MTREPSARRRGRKSAAAQAPKRQVNYRQLKNPFPLMEDFSGASDRGHA